MIGLNNKVIYETFGLNIASEITFPELPLSPQRNGMADVDIKLDDLTERYEAAVMANNRKVIVKDHSFMFRIPESAIFLVEHGRQITVSPVSDCDEGMLRLFILGSCMGALLLQRRLFPLHGSAVVIGGKAYAIVGESGAGKSTLASALVHRGMKFLSDDVVALSLSGHLKCPVVSPAYPQQKLWRESLVEFGMQANEFAPLYDRESKFSVPVRSQFVQSPTPLSGIFELIKSDKQQIELQPMGKLEQLSTLYHHTYRNFLIGRMELVDWHFKHSLSIASHVRFYRLWRPSSRFSAFELADLIIDTVKKQER